MKNDGKTLVRPLDVRCGGIKQMKMFDVGQLLVNDMSIDFIGETIIQNHSSSSSNNSIPIIIVFINCLLNIEVMRDETET